MPTVRLGGTVQYYAEQHGVQCHAVEHCGHESSSFSPVLQVLYRVKTHAVYVANATDRTGEPDVSY